MEIERLCTHCMTESDTPQGGSCPFCGRPMHMEPQLTHQLKPLTILQGKYLVGDVLGEGGFGITYIGLDMQLEMKVAIKEFYPNGYASRESGTTSTLTIYSGQSEKTVLKWRENFLREARTLGKVNSLSGVVGVREFFQENNTAYIIMDYLEGQTLKDYARACGGRIQAAMLLPAIEPVIASLQKVHELGLIHRDISPDNIMLGPDGSMKLLDFGAAREFQGEEERSLSVMLKQGYAPEEQYRRKKEDQGPWTDVYAMAGTIYKCLTGVTPPDSMERMRRDELVPPNQMGAGLNPAQEAALLRALAVLRENRTQSMEELHQGLYGTGIPGAKRIQTGTVAPGMENTSAPVDRTMGDPLTGQPVNPYVDPVTGQPVSPYVDPVTGQPVNPYVDPVTHQPIPPVPPAPKKGMGTGTKVAIGLGIACAVLITAGFSMMFFLRGRLQSAFGGVTSPQVSSGENNLQVEREDSDSSAYSGAEEENEGFAFNDPELSWEDEEDEEEPEENSGAYPYTPDGALQAYSDLLATVREEHPEYNFKIAMVRIDSDSIPEAVFRSEGEGISLVGLSPEGEPYTVCSGEGTSNAFCYSPGRGKFLINSYTIPDEGPIERDSYSFGSFSTGAGWVDDEYEASVEQYDGAYPHMGCFLNHQRVGQFEWISDMQKKYYIAERVEEYINLQGYSDTAQEAFAQMDGHLNDGNSANPMFYTHFFLPYAQDCYLAWDDLMGLNQQQERLARNEFYARYGMHFTSPDLQAHFNNEMNSLWYEDEGYTDAQVNEFLNEVERANLELILQYKNVNGY